MARAKADAAAVRFASAIRLAVSPSAVSDTLDPINGRPGRPPG
jgi:hypothetical protein